MSEAPSDSTQRLAVTAAQVAHEKGATDIEVLDVGAIVGICGAFVVASASNPRLVNAVVEEVTEQLADRFGEKPRSVEGAGARRWVLVDYGDVVVHVFLAEERDFYRIERLYGDAPRIDWH